MENVSDDLTVPISVNNEEPRLAIPVRAIPFVDLWRRFSPDVIPKYLTQKTFSSVKSDLTAYRITDGFMKAVEKHEWEGVIEDMKKYQSQVFNRFKIKIDERGNPTQIKDVAHVAWSKGVIRLLPSATFIWKDELVTEFESDDKRVIHISDRNKGEKLIFDPMRAHTKIKKIMEGFTLGNKTRISIFDEIIETAIIQSRSTKLNPVWIKLLSIVLSSKPTPKPFTGKSTEKSLEYRNEYSNIKLFTKEALKTYLWRRKKRLEAVYVRYVKVQ